MWAVLERVLTNNASLFMYVVIHQVPCSEMNPPSQPCRIQLLNAA